MNDIDLREHLEKVLDQKIHMIEPMSVGFGLTGAIVILNDKTRLAIKARLPSKPEQGKKDPSLAIEGQMLLDLARLSALPVPKVHFCAPDLLVMDYIDNDGGRIGAEAERDAAKLIAALHSTQRPYIGYERDTLIGPLPQPNPMSLAWVPFFRDQRLLQMARAARDEGQLPAPLYGRLEHLARSLDQYLLEPDFPSLLHGDLWTGNVLVKGDRIAGFVDPALYYGHREIELAFTTMFGTFGRTFFEVYESILPLEPGFHETRRDIYNLYPVLVHVRLFGASYLGAIEQTLRKLGM